MIASHHGGEVPACTRVSLYLTTSLARPLRCFFEIKKLTQETYKKWRALVNYVGGAIIFTTAHYADRLKLIGESGLVANDKGNNSVAIMRMRPCWTVSTTVRVFQLRKDIYAKFFAIAHAGHDYFKQSNIYLHLSDAQSW